MDIYEAKDEVSVRLHAMDSGVHLIVLIGTCMADWGLGCVGTAIGSTSDLISTFYFKCTRSLTNTTNPTFPASPSPTPLLHSTPFSSSYTAHTA